MQGAAAWVTVTARPAIVSVAERATPAVFAANLTDTPPLPVPEVAERVAHDAPDAAVQPHPAAVVTETAEVPPVLEGARDVGDTP